MAQTCPVCTSRHREEIERRLKEKESLRAISAWLQREKDEAIAKSTLSVHARAHMALPTEIGKQLLQAPAPTSPHEEEALPPLEALAKLQTMALTVAERMSQGVFLSMPEAYVFVGTLKEARQAAKNRYELVNGKKLHLTGELEVKRREELRKLSTEELEKLAAELAAEEGGHVH